MASCRGKIINCGVWCMTKGDVTRLTRNVWDQHELREEPEPSETCVSHSVVFVWAYDKPYLAVRRRS
jgi:hypothetical protein